MIESKNIFGERVCIACLVNKDGLLMLHHRSFNEEGLLESQGTLSLQKHEGLALAKEIEEACK